ncbi:hypothetical protein [Bauldia sp.]|uniref:hypothetical protein n=1 Tax=Bauldia sp. TaxID=2575872 RepID=UPI003BA9A33D
MFSKIAKLLLVASSIAPVGIVYAWVSAVESDYKSAIIILLVSFLLFLFCLYIVTRAQEYVEIERFRATTIEAADRENIAFLILYISPLFAAQFSSLNWYLWVPTIVIFGLITATGYSYHFNPLLGLMGWHFYKVQSTEGVVFVLITKKYLRTSADEFEVCQLTEYILLDVGG